MAQPYQSIFSGLFTEEGLEMARDVSMVGAIGGSLMSMSSAYYGLSAQKDALKEQAAQISFEAQVSEMNAVVTEQQIAKGRDALRKQVGVSQMEYAERKAQATTDAAARNVKVDSGSAEEQQAALQLASDHDALTMRIDAEEQFSGLARGARNLTTAAAMSRVQASNLRRTAKTMSPAMAFMTQGISSAAQVSSMFYKQFKAQ